MNYQSHKGRVHGLGTVGNGTDPGFFLHPMIALDAGSGAVIGCAELVMYVVEAKEVDCPDGQEPVHWRIFTTHVVTNFEEAKQIILWYRMRWTIEQVFGTLKSQGLNIEESQVESGEDLMKLAVLALCAAIQIMQLISGRDGTTELKTKDIFTSNEAILREK